jgi:hypothetical protein
MAHKLADNWRSQLIPSTGGNDPDGQMDLSTMNTDGVLAEGRHYLAGGDFRRLTGHADGINPIFITLTEFNENNVAAVTYTGQLVYEHPDTSRIRMVIVGKRHPEIIHGDPLLAVQQDQPWILTKP